MRWFILRVEMIRQYYMPGYTAYGKDFGHPPLCISHKTHRELREKPEEPPPARAVIQRRSLNAYQAADHSQPCEVGRSFCFLSSIPGAGLLQTNPPPLHDTRKSALRTEKTMYQLRHNGLALFSNLQHFCNKRAEKRPKIL